MTLELAARSGEWNLDVRENQQHLVDGVPDDRADALEGLAAAVGAVADATDVVEDGQALRHDAMDEDLVPEGRHVDERAALPSHLLEDLVGSDLQRGVVCPWCST